MNLRHVFLGGGLLSCHTKFERTREMGLKKIGTLCAKIPYFSWYFGGVNGVLTFSIIANSIMSYSMQSV